MSSSVNGVGQRDLLPAAPVEALRARLSKKWQEHPPDVLPLTVAETDFELAPAVAQALGDAMANSDTGYAYPRTGLATAFAGFAAARWLWDVDPADVTPGPDVGVLTVEMLRALGNDTRTAVISPPIYPPFYSWVEEAGMTAVPVPLDSGSRLDLAALERAFAAGPAVYLLCNPHNPVGTVPARDELAELVRLATANDVLIISDEIHAPLILDDEPFTPLLSVDGAAEVGVALHSPSKTWNLAGLKCSAVVASSARTRRWVNRLPAGLPSRVGHLGVIASTAAYTDTSEWLDRLLRTLRIRRDHLDAMMRDRVPQLTWQPPAATYLAWIDASVLGTGDDPCDVLMRRGRVAVQSGSAFGAPPVAGFIRLNFATSAEILDDAVTRIAQVVGD